MVIETRTVVSLEESWVMPWGVQERFWGAGNIFTLDLGVGGHGCVPFVILCFVDFSMCVW